jgi:hypothetical protein
MPLPLDPLLPSVVTCCRHCCCCPVLL